MITYDDDRPGKIISLEERKPIAVITSIEDISGTVPSNHLKSVLTFESIEDAVQRALEKGPIELTRNGLRGKGYDRLDTHTRDFLERWTSDYLVCVYRSAQQLDLHSEVRNYRRIMRGALRGVIAGVVVGVALDYGATATHSTGVGWEIAARSVPALAEAEEIARPFLGRLGAWYQYARGKTEEKPEPLTTTEMWATTQLLGPVIGAGMLGIGAVTGWNNDPSYKAVAVVTLNTGNNVIGAMAAYAHCFAAHHYLTLETYRHHGRPSLAARTKKFFANLHTALFTFWADSFQSSNMLVASSWYGAEQILRQQGIAAEQVNFGSGDFGGRTLAALESGLLSCDTAAAARLAIAREEKKMEKEVRLMTSRAYLQHLYEETRPEFVA